MQEDKSKLFSFAMQSGLFLGIFWVVKYLFVVSAIQNSTLEFLGPIFSAITPAILFQYLIKYRISIVDNKMSFWHGVQFSIMLFFFASLFEAMAAFVHITWIDPMYVGNMYADMTDMLRNLNLSESLVKTFSEQPIPNAFSYILNQVILGDVLIGLILSMFIVPISKLINPKNITTKQSDRNE